MGRLPRLQALTSHLSGARTPRALGRMRRSPDPPLNQSEASRNSIPNLSRFVNDPLALQAYAALRLARKERLHTGRIMDLLQFCEMAQANSLPPIRPHHGQCFYSESASLRYFNQDGYTYLKKQRSHSVREDHVKLRLNGDAVVMAIYSHIVDANEHKNGFHRRSYCLLNSKSEKRGVLVHYQADETPEGPEDPADCPCLLCVFSREDAALGGRIKTAYEANPLAFANDDSQWPFLLGEKASKRSRPNESEDGDNVNPKPSVDALWGDRPPFAAESTSTSLHLSGFGQLLPSSVGPAALATLVPSSMPNLRPFDASAPSTMSSLESNAAMQALLNAAYPEDSHLAGAKASGPSLSYAQSVLPANMAGGTTTTTTTTTTTAAPAPPAMVPGQIASQSYYPPGYNVQAFFQQQQQQHRMAVPQHWGPEQNWYYAQQQQAMFANPAMYGGIPPGQYPWPSADQSLRWTSQAGFSPSMMYPKPGVQAPPSFPASLQPQQQQSPPPFTQSSYGTQMRTGATSGQPSDPSPLPQIPPRSEPHARSPRPMQASVPAATQSAPALLVPLPPLPEVTIALTGKEIDVESNLEWVKAVVVMQYPNSHFVVRYPDNNTVKLDLYADGRARNPATNELFTWRLPIEGLENEYVLGEMGLRLAHGVTDYVRLPFDVDSAVVNSQAEDAKGVDDDDGPEQGVGDISDSSNFDDQAGDDE